MKGNNKKRNGKRRPSNRKREDYRPERGGTYGGRNDGRDEAPDRGRNDISWYTRNPNLIIAGGSFPYPNRPGMTVEVGKNVDGTARTYAIPGVMVLDWMPSVGISQVATDPISVSAKEMYSRVRKVFGGTNLVADAPDFPIYMMALDSIFSYIAWLKRLYRLLVAWSPNNYVTPDILTSALGFSDKDIAYLRTHRTQLWQSINELVLQSRKFTCPAGMDIFNRHYWMSDNVYTDDATINSQFYVFNLKAVYQFAMLDMPDGNPGPGLQMVAMPNVITPPSDLVTVEVLYQFGLSLINALVEWDDAYVINGYLMKAYEGDANFIVDELPADQPLTPVYEPEVLAQIENSRAVPAGEGITDFSGFNVTQSVPTNAIISKPQYVATQDYNNVFKMGGAGVEPTLSSRSDMPTVADNVIASRLQACCEVTPSEDGNSWTVQVTAGTEIPIAWRTSDGVSTLRAETVPFAQNVIAQVGGYSNETAAQTIMNTVSALFRMEAYDWHPFVFVTSAVTVGEKTVYRTNIAGDVHNFTTISKQSLKNLHRICILSEFNAFSM